MKPPSLILAALMMATVGTASACSSPDPAASPAQQPPSNPTDPSKSAGPRAPVATVLWSGKIAYPHITLTTWGHCPFIIEDVERVKVGVLRVVGREASTGCDEGGRRHSVTYRLDRKLRAGPEFEKQVTVVSQQPEYQVDAQVRRIIA